MSEVPVLVIAAALAAATVGSLSALLERSGPIRLRSWAEEAGEDLRLLYGRPGAFGTFRALVSLLARISLVAFAVAMFVYLEVSETTNSAWWALLAGALLALVMEIGNRFLGRRSEEALRAATVPIRVLYRLLFPLLALLGLTVGRRLERPVVDDADDATREEIDAFIDVGRREGILEADEGELVRGLVDFGDTQVRSVMTPRVDMACAPIDASPEELVELVLATGRSRLPIYRGSIDEIAGILHVRDLLRVVSERGDKGIEDYLRPTHFVPETKDLDQLLRELQERHQEMAVVVDEYGGTEGLVTIEDLVEEIVGEIVDEHDEGEPEHVEIAPGIWRIDGRSSIEELHSMFPGLAIGGEEYETVGGLVFGILGRVPKVGDRISSLGLDFVVERADRRRARILRVERAVETVEEIGNGDSAD